MIPSFHLRNVCKYSGRKWYVTLIGFSCTGSINIFLTLFKHLHLLQSLETLLDNCIHKFDIKNSFIYYIFKEQWYFQWHQYRYLLMLIWRQKVDSNKDLYHWYSGILRFSVDIWRLIQTFSINTTSWFWCKATNGGLLP